MAFKLENEMTAPVERWLRERGYLVKREFPVPWGICDLVGCIFNKRNVKKRLELRQTKPVGSELRVHLLSHIPDDTTGQSTSVRELHDLYSGYLDSELIEEGLERLKKDKFVVEVSDGEFQKVNGWLPLHRSLIAVELKLSRVEEVVHQATSNLGFADESYVALPGELARHLSKGEKRARFTEKRIGLLAVDDDGCRVVIRAQRSYSARFDAVTHHCAERFWTLRSKGSSA